MLIHSVAGSYRVFGLNLTGGNLNKARSKTQFETTLPLLMPLIIAFIGRLISSFMFAADVKTCRDSMEINDQLKKLKKPSYLGWLIFRVWLALACGVIGVFSCESGGAINVILWTLLGAGIGGYLTGAAVALVTPAFGLLATILITVMIAVVLSMVVTLLSEMYFSYRRVNL